MKTDDDRGAVEWGYARLADGNCVCMGCGALVHSQHLNDHDVWHRWANTVAATTEELARAYTAALDGRDRRSH